MIQILIACTLIPVINGFVDASLCCIDEMIPPDPVLAKIDFCKNGIGWDHLIDAAKTGVNKAVYNGDQGACDQYLDHEIGRQQAKLDENIRFIDRLKFMP